MQAGEKGATSVLEHHPQGEEAAGSELPRVGQGLDAVVSYLLSIQHNDGHWCGELEGDTVLETEYVLGLYFLGRGHEERARKAVNYVRDKQLPEGGWAIYPGGPPEVSATVKAYFVLKLFGDDPEAPHMQRARQTVLGLGGLDACNSFTKLYLSIFGQYEWGRAPAVPPELILLPRWFFFNIYEWSSWSRAIVVPLSVIWALKPACPVPEELGISELRTSTPLPRPHSGQTLRDRLWSKFFVAVDRTFKLLEALSIRPLRNKALDRCEAWFRKRLERSDGLAAIFPAILNTVIALVCRGYRVDDPVVRKQMHELEKLEIVEGDTLRLQPCFSPVWDTALALTALREAGLPAHHPALVRGAQWLLSKEVTQVGDWKERNPDGQPGGWYFEYANEFYPDCDDTAEVLAALSQLKLPPDLAEQREEALHRALNWQLSMQNRDGGWAAFDKGCDREILTLVPFADHNAMIDPSTADITGRTLEALACFDFKPTDPVVQRAVRFLYREQEEDGSWYGRWGCNYIYGTWLALGGLRSVGEEMDSEPCRRAVGWLLGCQNADGGWGESLHSYDDPSLKGKGPSTATQTAWAMMGLLIAGFEGRLDEGEIPHALARGAAYLLDTQRNDGSWQDEFWSGTGFPKVFYLRYHLYASYFPLQALGMYRRALELGYGVNRAA